MKCRLPLIAVILCFLLQNHAWSAASFLYRIPAVSGPTDPVVVYVDLTSNRSNVAALGCRLVYNSADVALTAVEKGSGAPSSWTFLFRDTTTSGQIDIVLTDPTSSAVTIDFPSSREMVKLTFNRVRSSCAQSSFGFNFSPPAAGPPTSAFPVNQYVISVTSTINVETASTSSRSGPSVIDRSFVRGNVANRSAHSRDIQDVVDLVATLLGGFVPGFDCDAAFDVNNDGLQNIADVVALVQGVFGATAFVIPGPSTPGVVVPDGGTIPSVLGCNEGESCP